MDKSPGNREVRKLGASSLLYLSVTFVTRGLNVLLLPVYARRLSPDDFGILAITSTLTVLLSGVATLGVSGAVTRMHHAASSDEERRRFYGSLFIFLAVLPGLAVFGFELAAAHGFTGLRHVAFVPYLRLATYAAWLSGWMPVVIGHYMVRERPRVTGTLQTFSALSQVGCMLLFVVVFAQGAVGAVRAAVLSAGLQAIVAIVILVRLSSVPRSIEPLRRALAFSIPLVPHSLSQWGLAVSDRYILERSVSSVELGLYAIAYQFADLAMMVAAAVNASFSPMVIRLLKDPEQASIVPRLGTYSFGAMLFAALGAAMFGGDVIRLAMPPVFHGAAAYVPLVVLGAAFYGVYLVVAQGTVYSMKMGAVPIMTLLACGVNVGLNLVLVPRFGAMAAAFTTAVSYALLAVLHGLLSHRLYPIPWEYGRILMLLAVGVVVWFLGRAPWVSSAVGIIGWRVFSLSVIFPGLLLILRFLRPDELSALGAIARRVLRFAPAGSRLD